MLLELSEVLACPSCGPPEVLVAVVHEASGRSVIRGFLACPTCDSRYPIEAGVARLTTYTPPQTPAGLPGPKEDSGETPVLVAALLGLESGTGHVLFGAGLDSVAVAVAELAQGWSILSTVSNPGIAAGPSRPNLSRLSIAPGEPFPIQPGRIRAVALDGARAAEDLPEAVRVLSGNGRVVVLTPNESMAGRCESTGLEVMGSDRRAVLAVKAGRQTV